MIDKEYNHYLDIHCHYDELSADILRNCFDKNNILALSASVDINSYERLEQLRKEKIKGLYLAYGLYPDEVVTKPLPKLLDELKKINFENAIAIGEIGLDNKVTKDKQLRENQKILFTRQLEIAEKLNKPVVVHTRYATKATLEVLKDYPKLKIILHWFSGNNDEIKEALSRGYSISNRFGKPIINNVTEYLGQIFIETDYPIPYNNQPAKTDGIIESYNVFCKENNLELDLVKKTMVKNFSKLFNIKIDEL